MNWKGLISFFAFALLVLISIINSTGCANIIPPQGGPKDTIPPVLIKATPADSTRNFSANRINLSFNEYIDLQNMQENLLVSPIPKINPIVESKLNTVTIRLKDSLEANTTYTLNFGNAIKDYNEGNVMKNFTYIFSTGRYLDSLELSGGVILAETGKIDSTLIVMLYTNPDDSAVIKEKPRYITKLDGKGNFVFKNLPSKIFYLYALKDESGTHRYFGDKQLFGFSGKPIRLDSNTATAPLYAYATQPPVAPINVPSINIGGRKKGAEGIIEKRLKYQSNITNNKQDLLSDFIFTFEHPLRMFDSTRLQLFTDTSFTPVSGYSFSKDSTNRKVKLSITWKENTSYHIILNKDFATDTLGNKLLKTDTLSFLTKKISEYGSLQVKFKNLDMTMNPVLQFIVNDGIYKTFPLTSPLFSREIFLPGEYELRILYDENKNGKWDPGIFFEKHKQPEIVKSVERKITIKTAWKNEFEIQPPL